MPKADPALLTLGFKLCSMGPPSFVMLIARLEDQESFVEFVKIVRDLLPEREQEIFSQPTPGEQIGLFLSFFQDRYFPLEEYWGENEDYSQLIYRIPVVAMGFSEDDYHDMVPSLRSGLQLMAYIVEPSDDGGEVRVSLAEECRNQVSIELLERVGDGISRGDLHTLLDNTPHSALAVWADYLSNDTGNGFMDTTYEDIAYEQTDWDRENVEFLTPLWREAEQIQQRYTAMAEWLEENPPERFKELIDFIDRRRVEHGRKLKRRRSSPAVGAA